MIHNAWYGVAPGRCHSQFHFLCAAAGLLHLKFGVCFKFGADFVCAVCGFLSSVDWPCRVSIDPVECRLTLSSVDWPCRVSIDPVDRPSLSACRLTLSNDPVYWPCRLTLLVDPVDNRSWKLIKDKIACVLARLSLIFELEYTFLLRLLQKNRSTDVTPSYLYST